MFVAFAIAAVCLSPPVDGPVIAEFAPIGRYGGHWGLDFQASPGQQVRAPASGIVTFAGTVAGNTTVTIQPVPGLKVSVSYLTELFVTTGDRVSRGQEVGRAGRAHGHDGVHFSVRIDGRYADPQRWLGCRDTDITRALRLLEPPRPYPRSRAHRNPRRDLRPDPRRSSPHCGVRPPPIGTRPGPGHTRR